MYFMKGNCIIVILAICLVLVDSLTFFKSGKKATVIQPQAGKESSWGDSEEFKLADKKVPNEAKQTVGEFKISGNERMVIPLSATTSPQPVLATTSSTLISPQIEGSMKPTSVVMTPTSVSAPEIKTTPTDVKKAESSEAAQQQTSPKQIQKDDISKESSQDEEEEDEEEEEDDEKPVIQIVSSPPIKSTNSYTSAMVLAAIVLCAILFAWQGLKVYMNRDMTFFELVNLLKSTFRPMENSYVAPDFQNQMDDPNNIHIGYDANSNKQVFWQANSVEGI